MKKFFLCLLFILISTISYAHTNTSHKMTSSFLLTPAQHEKLTPQEALKKLKQGNLRFVEAKKRKRDYLNLAKITSVKGQYPFALVLSCIDSRSIPDLMFDQGLGNLFVARDAGNIAGPTIYGSMEFAVKVTGSALIVVMGHTACGAVRAACIGKGSGHLMNLIDSIRPAAVEVMKQSGNKDCNSPKLITAIAKQNVINQINLILKNIPAFDQLIKQNKLMIVGAMHNLKTGEVVFFDRNGKEV